jgi:hypothetical protein
MSSNTAPLPLSSRRLLNNAEAASYRGVAATTANNERCRDRQRIERGEEPIGPPWVMINGSPFYEIAALDAWIESRSEPFGIASRPQLQRTRRTA